MSSTVHLEARSTPNIFEIFSLFFSCQRMTEVLGIGFETFLLRIFGIRAITVCCAQTVRSRWLSICPFGYRDTPTCSIAFPSTLSGWVSLQEGLPGDNFPAQSCQACSVRFPPSSPFERVFAPSDAIKSKEAPFPFPPLSPH